MLTPEPVPDSAPAPRRELSLLALLLLVPVPSIGTLCLPESGESTAGLIVFGFAKVWILVVPTLWLWFVERKRFSLSPVRHGGIGMGIALGLIISAVIYGTFLVIGPMIDPAAVRDVVAARGLDRLWVYIGATLYFFTINAVLEEYVWRWFVFRRCEDLMPRWIAVLASAAMFTAHHVIVLRNLFDWDVTALASAGVFVGGAVWSWCYLKYRSIWPGWASHALVDITIFVIGYQLIFVSG